MNIFNKLYNNWKVEPDIFTYPLNPIQYSFFLPRRCSYFRPYGKNFNRNSYGSKKKYYNYNGVNRYEY